MRNPIEASLNFDRAIKDVVAWAVRRLIARDALLASRAVLMVARMAVRHEPVRADDTPAASKDKPQGPFRNNGVCDLFIFVPRSLESFLIDEATGHYGYSHVAVDCGEVELATGKRVMIESSPGLGVHRNYQDHYGPRPFARIPFAFPGTDPVEFRKCIQSVVGEAYDKWEVLTWAQVDDPAKQICSDLVAACLAPRTLASFERKERAGGVGRRTMSSHRKFGRRSHIFISPNGFAQFLGLPHGKSIHHPDQLVEARLGRKPARVFDPWPIVFGIGTVALGAVIAWRLRMRAHKPAASRGANQS